MLYMHGDPKRELVPAAVDNSVSLKHGWIAKVSMAVWFVVPLFPMDQV